MPRSEPLTPGECFALARRTHNTPRKALMAYTSDRGLKTLERLGTPWDHAGWWARLRALPPVWEERVTQYRAGTAPLALHQWCWVTRRRLGLRAEDAANALGVSLVRLYAYEAGEAPQGVLRLRDWLRGQLRRYPSVPRLPMDA